MPKSLPDHCSDLRDTLLYMELLESCYILFFYSSKKLQSQLATPALLMSEESRPMKVGVDYLERYRGASNLIYQQEGFTKCGKLDSWFTSCSLRAVHMMCIQIIGKEDLLASTALTCLFSAYQYPTHTQITPSSSITMLQAYISYDPHAVLSICSSLIITYIHSTAGNSHCQLATAVPQKSIHIAHQPSRQVTIRVGCKYDDSDPELPIVMDAIILPPIVNNFDGVKYFSTG